MGKRDDERIPAEAASVILQAVLAQGPWPVCVIDKAGCILAIDRAPDGQAARDRVGGPCLALVGDADRAALQHAIDLALRTGEPAGCDVHALDTGGAPRWQVIRIVPLPAGAAPARALLITEDITAQRQAERALQRTRQALDAVIDNAPGLLCLIRGADLRLQLANRAYRALAPGKSMLGRTLDEIWPEAGRDFATLCRHVLETGEPYRTDDDVNLIRSTPEGPVEARSFTWSLHRIRLPGEDGWSLLNTGIETTAYRATERRLQRALQDVAASEERLRLALDAASEGLWDWDLITNACHYSPGYHAMLGHAPDTLPGQLAGMQQLVHPDDLHLAALGPRLLHDPGHFVLRFRMRAADGHYRWIESRGKTVRRDAEGQPLRAIGTHLDITDRVRLEGALRRSEAQLRAIVDGTTDAIYVKDLQGRHLLVNQAACAVLGRDAADIIGQDLWAVTNTETARAMTEHDRRVIDAGATMSFQETLVTPDGATRTFLSTKGPLRDDNGMPVGLFGIARDITDLLRHEAEQRQALAHSRELLDLALTGSELGTWDLDLVAGTQRLDDRYGAMLGYGSGELTPTPQEWERWVHPEDLPTLHAAVQAHARGETRLCEVEYRLRHRDGHWIWVLDRGKFIRDDQGRPVRATGTTQDISDRRHASAEGVALVKQLERLITGLGAGMSGEMPSASMPVPPALAELSARGREVLALLAEGLTSAEIGARLNISPETASTHRRNLMRRLGVRNRAELIRLAIEHGVVPVARPPKP